MRRNLLNDLIESFLRTPAAVDDHGTFVMRFCAYTIAALTLAVNSAPLVRVRGKRHRPFTRAEVREAVLARSALIVTRQHRPSGETLYKWVDASDQAWAHVNGYPGEITMFRRHGLPALRSA